MCFHGTIKLGEQATRERRLLFFKGILFFSRIIVTLPHNKNL